MEQAEWEIEQENLQKREEISRNHGKTNDFIKMTLFQTNIRSK